MAELTRNRSLAVTRTLGAITLLLIGGIHYQQYHYAFYSAIPTIGPLFLLNFIGATALGLLLLAPGRSRLGRVRTLLDQLAALAGIGLAVSGLAALLISEHMPLFGFMEHGYRFVIVLTITAEAVAIALLTLFLVKARSRAHERGAPLTQKRSAARLDSDPVDQRPVAAVGSPTARRSSASGSSPRGQMSGGCRCTH
jgi:hypothetical protein